MKTVFFVFATLFLLQGQTAFAESYDSCCPPGETAVGWKCGQTVYRCPSPTNSSEPIATCDQGVGEATEVIVSSDECNQLKLTAIDENCLGYGQALSNRICLKDGLVTKADKSECGTCDTPPPNTTPPPTEVPSEIPSEIPSETPTPPLCDKCLPEHAGSWKCGLNVYICPGVQDFCGSQANEKFYRHYLNHTECEDMKGLELDQECPGGHGLSNYVCYDGDGFPISKVDDEGLECCFETDPPVPTPTSTPPPCHPTPPPPCHPTEPPTPSICSDCDVEDAWSWKCGNVVYVCPGYEDNVGCNQGSATSNTTLLSAGECLAFKSGTLQLDGKCPVGGKGLSNYVCYDGEKLPFTKIDGDGYDCCFETDPPVPTPTSTPPPHPTEHPTPSTCGDCPVYEAESWKCGNVVYVCPGFEANVGCSQGSATSGDPHVLTPDECAAFKDKDSGLDVLLETKCPGSEFALSNYVCYDDYGLPFTKVDDKGPKCCNEETEPPVFPEEETEPPVFPEEDPRGSKDLVLVEPETPPPTDVNRQSPEETQPPEKCPNDVILVDTDGTASFPPDAITVISQDIETVTISVAQAFSSENLAALFYQYYESVFSEKCYQAEQMEPDDSFEITVQCTHSSQIALVEFWVVDQTLSYDENDAIIPDCCHAELLPETPVVKHLVEIRCVSCPGATTV